MTAIRIVDVESIGLGTARYLLSDGRLFDIEEGCGPGYWWRSMRKLSTEIGVELHPRDYDHFSIRYLIEESMSICPACHDAQKAFSIHGLHNRCEACVESCECYDCVKLGDRSIFQPPSP